ncbi:MAG: alpha/beta hydrolase [Candidatus Syntropharchaeia archaeon]
MHRDLSFLDIPGFQLVFFPRKDLNPQPSVENAENHFIDVDGVKIGCRFYISGKDSPSILYFHGNGEIVSDHDWIAPFFNKRRINLFVTDYRGYGFSDGVPSMSRVILDAHPIFHEFKKMIKDRGYSDNIFVMGRSLGSIPAVELAFHYQDDIQGLIIESGVANTFSHLSDLFGIHIDGSLLKKMEKESNKEKIRSIRIPTLIIHGEYDSIIPLSEGRELYVNSGANDKKFVLISGANHNSILIVDPERYFNEIERFVRNASYI